MPVRVDCECMHDPQRHGLRVHCRHDDVAKQSFSYFVEEYRSVLSGVVFRQLFRNIRNIVVFNGL